MMVLKFEKSIYSVDSILATVYWAADRAVADLHQNADVIEVELTPKEGILLSGSFVDDFKGMAVHNQIRHQLEEKFAPLEKVIVEKAFSPVMR